MAVIINKLITGSMGVGTGSSAPSEPTAPNGKVLYKTSANGEWLQSDATITGGDFTNFDGIQSAVAVIIPSKDVSGNNVTSIGQDTFYHCTKLTSVTIPDSVTRINNNSFIGCSNLTSVTIPAGVTRIEPSAFEDCYSLTSMTIPNSATYIGEGAFCSCGLTNLTIPDSVTSIGYSAFEDCSDLTSVTITANGGNAEYVKQKLISAGVSSSITWNMPS